MSASCSRQVDPKFIGVLAVFYLVICNARSECIIQGVRGELVKIPDYSVTCCLTLAACL